ncbi:MAG: hypothetical protein ACFCD0_03430 [Gemmataceae bacterium]
MAVRMACCEGLLMFYELVTTPSRSASFDETCMVVGNAAVGREGLAWR